MEKSAKIKHEVFQDTNAFEPLDFFVIRTPLLPVSHYYELSKSILSPVKIDDLIKSDPKIESALAVGNPSFYEAVKKTAEKEKQDKSSKDSAKDSEKVFGKLLRILTRMSTRSTPFGLYAGVALGNWRDKSSLSVAEVGTQSRTRLDMELVAKFSLGLENKLLPQLKLIANPTLRRFSGRLYLLEKAPVLNQQDIDGSWLEATDEVLEIVELAQKPIAYSTLLTTVTEKCNMYEEDAHALIEYMLENTYLFSSLRPNTFEPEIGERLLQLSDDAIEERKQMEELRQSIKAINDGGLIDPAFYLKTSECAKSTLGVQSSSGLQTDMRLKLSANSLNKSVATEISRYTDLLMRIAPLPVQGSPLKAYKELFFAKYEMREVPILELLNQEYGLGFPEYISEWSFNLDEYARQILLDELICAAIRDRKVEVELDAETLSKLLVKSKDFNYPVSADIFLTLVASSLEDIDAGNYLLTNGGAMAGAGRNLGRFADLLGEDATEALKSVVDAEKKVSGKELLAELSSLPRAFRLGNVCTVPFIRPHRIVLDSWPEMQNDDNENADNLIPLNDLLVGLENSRFYLRSAKHGVKVRIQSPSLVNPLFKTQIARFLTTVNEDSYGFGGRLRWGTASDANFKPRLRYERFILAPAEWTIRLTAAKHDEFANVQRFKDWLAKWRERWFVPRYVQLRDMDNLLLIDLDNEVQTEELRRELCNKKNASINLQEAFCTPEALWSTGPGGKFASEIVASFVRAGGEKKLPDIVEESQLKADPNKITEADRVRCPGHEWIYLKLYSGKSLHDDLLVLHIGDFVDSLKEQQLIDAWFFIKYADPDPHLRVRFHGDPDTLNNSVLQQVIDFSNSLVDGGLCIKFQLDAYNREIERYGGLEAISLAEEFFAADSELVATLLRLEVDESWALDRALVVNVTLDKMLQSLGLDSETRNKWYKKYAPGRNEVGEEFRKLKDQLHAIFSFAYGASEVPADRPDIQAVVVAVQKCSDRLQKVGKQYHKLAETQRLAGTIDDIYSSFVHMHCNRYLGIDHKAEWKARSLACRGHEAHAHRKTDSQKELQESSVST